MICDPAKPRRLDRSAILRNDAIGNGAVVMAGITATGRPDVLVAGAMAGSLPYSAIQIIRQALEELRQTPLTRAPQPAA